MKLIEHENKKYELDEILTVEVESATIGMVVGNQSKPIPFGKSELEIKAYELPMFIEQIETEVEELNRAKSTWDKTVEAEKKALLARGIKENDEIQKLLVAKFRNPDRPDNHIKRFYDAVHRWPKPLRSIKVLSSRKSPTMKTALDNHTETMSMLNELIKQNSDLIKALSKSKGA